MNVAIVDLGTNTFNCCVISLDKNKFSKLLDFNEFPQLGANGVAFGIISDDAMERGIQSLKIIRQRIEDFHCEKIKLIGTSALRNAKNSNIFCQRAKIEVGFDIEIISGEQEAEYIFWGNNLAHNWGNKTALILDIGGGSNECIICKHNSILWKHSFECGMQRIVSKFGLYHPYNDKTKKEITDYLSEKFDLLESQLSHYKIDLLVGSSGAFDVFRSIYYAQKGEKNPSTPSEEIPIPDFMNIVEYLTNQTIGNIHSMKGMDLDRAELLPIAGIIASFFISQYSLSQLVQSSYSLKEGVIHTMME